MDNGNKSSAQYALHSKCIDVAGPLKWKFKLISIDLWSLRNVCWVCKRWISVVSLVTHWNHMSHMFCKAEALCDYLLKVSMDILENGDVSQIFLLEIKYLFQVLLMKMCNGDVSQLLEIKYFFTGN